MRNFIRRAIDKIGTRRFRYALTALWALALLALTACGIASSTAVAPSPLPSQPVTPSPVVPEYSTAPTNTPDVTIPSSSASAPVRKLESLAVLNQQYAEYGSITIEGMSVEDYDAALALQWTEVSTPGDPLAHDIDLTAHLSVDTLEQYILNLGRYEGVDITVIGRSELGRNIYMVTVNVGGGSDKPLIMLSGGVHAREFAGTDYLVKCLNDTLAKAQTDADTMSMLSRVTIVAVPLVNPDGRALIMGGGDPDRKSNANGVDLNRGMPSVNAGQLAASVQLTEDFSTEPGIAFFAGSSLGTESETQAMIKWFNTFVPKAAVYIDMHQQGGISYYNKPFATSESDEACLNFAQSMNTLMGRGYTPKSENLNYALNGDGGTMTDYARSVSEGFVYSYRLGRMALLMDGTEVPLICFGDIDNHMEYYQPVNSRFLAMTFEIGRNRGYLGPKKSAREKRAAEYERYGWKNFLTGTIEIVLGKDE